MCDILEDCWNTPVIINWVLHFWWREYILKEFPWLPEELIIAGWLWWQNRSNGILNYRGVPEEFLPYALAHESFCWFIDGSWSCVDSVKKELKLVPSSIKNEYIEWRIKFFEWMCNYARNKVKQWEYYEKLLREMENSLKYLNWQLIWVDTQDKVWKLI